MSKCALLLDVWDLVHGMFCKRHVRFVNILVLFQCEVGEWVFRGFKNQSYGTLKTLALIGQACLLSAVIAPEFVGLATDILRVPLFEKAELS